MSSLSGFNPLSQKSIHGLVSINADTALIGNISSFSASSLSVSNSAQFNCSPNLSSGKSYNISGTAILSSTTLGSTITNSSLTTVGNLANLNVDGDCVISGDLSSPNVNNLVSNTRYIQYDNGDEKL